MFDTVQKYQTTAKILLGLVALTFVGFGVSTVASPGSDYILKVGNQKISEHDLTRMLGRTGQNATDEVRQSIFNTLVQQNYLIEGAEAMGLSVSPEQIKKVIVSEPAFQENGQFQQAKFNEYLSQQHLSEEAFVADLKKQFYVQSVLNLVQAGQVVSDAQAKQAMGLLQATRQVRTVTFNTESQAASVAVDDAKLQAHYQANQKNYALPQAVKFEFVVLSAKDLADKQTVTDAEIKAFFEKNQANSHSQRQVAHILFAVPKGADDAAKAAVKAKAEAVLKQAKAKPAEFAALAKQHSQDPGSAAKGGDVGFFAQDGTMVKPFEEAAFRLPEGQISDLVETEYGYHILKVLAVKEPGNLAQNKDQIVAQLKLEKAAAALRAQKEKMADLAFNQPNELNTLAKALGVKVEQQANWMTQAEAEQNQMPAEWVQALFSADALKNKHNSDPIQVGDALWVVRPTEVRAAATLPFAEAKERVKADYVRQQAQKQAMAAAKAALAQVQQGQAPALSWSPVQALSADVARMQLPPEAYRQILAAKVSDGKPAYVLLEGLPAPVLMEIQSVKLPEDMAAQLPQAKAVLSQQQANGVLSRYLKYLETQIKTKQGAQKVVSGN